MSDEQSISVAELLARSGGAAAPAGGRRRRHRGGENSITVAELTGEIPVVRDEPVADPDAEQAVPTPAEQAPEAPQAPASDLTQAPAADLTRAPAADVAQPPAADATDTFDVVRDAEPQDEPVGSASLAQAVADTGRFQAIDPGNVDEAPIQSRVQQPEAPTQAPEVEQTVEPVEPVESGTPEAAADVTTVHTNEGHAPVDHAWSQWSDGAAPGMATADFNTAQVRERQARFGKVDEAAPAAEQDEAPEVPDTAALSLQKITDSQDADLAPVDTLPGADQAVEPLDEHDADAATDDGARSGKAWALLIAEVLGGVIAGAALFYGFYQLWNWGGGTWTIALTVALAFVVIIAIVTFTHYLRKTTDYVTLGLALFVGLVITFGPLAMSLSQN